MKTCVDTNSQEIFESIFKTYDVRGVYDKELTREIAEEIGKGFGTFIGAGKNLVVGRDIRLGSETLMDGVVKGLASVGCNVVDIGVVTTPVLYFAIAHKRKDGGVMITGSHNPPEWNGFKLCRENGIIIAEGTGIEEIKRIVMTQDFNKTASPGKIQGYDGILDEYARFVLAKIKISKRLKVILDTCNSVSGIISPKLFRSVGCEVTVLNESLNGHFPAHLPEPKEETLQQLREEVIKGNADMGIGYDGDGDRCVFVDDKGRILTGDIVSIIFSELFIESERTKIVYDISCSSAVDEAIRARGGIPVVERVGRSFMMKRVLEENAAFGGERSGHFYFSEIYGLDDGTFASLKMAEILCQSETTLSQMVDSIPRYCASPTVNIPCPDEHKNAVVNKLKDIFATRGFKILEKDGVKAHNDSGWVLIRPSNTEPLLRILSEGKTEEKMNQLLNQTRKTVEREVERIS